MHRLLRPVLIGLAVGLAGLIGFMVGTSRSADPAVSRPSPPDNEELRRLYSDDQADRQGDARAIDWAAVLQRDRARRERVRTLVAQGGLAAANDYYHAAMVLQHGEEPGDFLLAHELAVAALVTGKRDGEAAWLAAAAEDRFLTRIGRPQRFGTQYRADDDGPWRLEPVDPTVSDGLRRVMGVPSLEETRARVNSTSRDSNPWRV